MSSSGISQHAARFSPICAGRPAAQDRRMIKLWRIPAKASPYVAALSTGLLIAMMIATMSITAFERQWIVFLSGALAAAVFAFVSRATNSRWVIARRTSQLNAARAKLATESRLLVAAERELARLGTYHQFADVAMPAKLAYVDDRGVVRYHNHAYASWVNLPGGAIDGRPLEQSLGRTIDSRIETHLMDALQGNEVRYERAQENASGAMGRLFVQYLPRFGDGRRVSGVFVIMTDTTPTEDLRAPVAPSAAAIPIDGMAPASDAARLVAAIEHDEFRLYYQSIAALGAAGEGASFREILLRLKEEEDNLLPPGSFLPVAEEHGLMPQVDRWVVRHVLEAAAVECLGGDPVYFVNVAAQTVAEGSLAAFVRAELASRSLRGSILCFEFPEPDVLANPRAYRDLIAALEGSECRFAVSGVGRNPASIPFFSKLRVNYFKLDGAVVLAVLRDPGALEVVKAINDAAHRAGMQVVAQCVEDEATRAALHRAGTDFVQGFGIAMPRPMQSTRGQSLHVLPAVDGDVGSREERSFVRSQVGA
jgi:EAL domain-containing protein (putative c-di-GMP-specific phosphodiesterase class I)/PAS domain-containing protein